jgi:hypothetical protein
MFNENKTVGGRDGKTSYPQKGGFTMLRLRQLSRGIMVAVVGSGLWIGYLVYVQPILETLVKVAR